MEDGEAPEPPKTPEKSEIPAEPLKDVKNFRNRRRSSIGSDILSAFKSEATQETMSPIEVRPPRPKRVIPPKVEPPPPVPVTQRKKEVRYSFDLGEPVETKSCLKSSTAPILVRKGVAPVPKSITQRPAAKTLNKNVTETPVTRKEGNLKFSNTCTIRVITPRPDYNPESLEMPHSDDETDAGINPNRERLSTVPLRLTPVSQSRLEEMQEKDVVQFNAEMVFGDRDESGEDLKTAKEDVPIASDAPGAPGAPEASTASEASTTSSELPKDSKDPEEVVKKKTSRRKSLILGAASPLKNSPAKIERPRFDDDTEDQISEPKRRHRRSVRLQNPPATNSASESSSSELLEAEPFATKKRELLEEPSTSSEPQAKRTRRKSQVPPVREEKNAERRRKSVAVRKEVVETSEPPKIHSFFAPKTSASASPSSTSSESKKTSEKPERKVSKRRSTRFALPPKDDVLEILEIPTTFSEDVVELVQVQMTSTSSEVAPEIDAPTPETPKPQPLQKLASIFTPKSSKPTNSVVEDVKKSETSGASTKIFSIFSPKPKPKEPAEIVNLTENSPKIQIQIQIQKTSRPSEAHKQPNIEDHYRFFTKIPVMASIFDDNDDDEVMKNVFKPRQMDSEVLTTSSESNGFQLKLITSSTEDVALPSSSEAPEEFEKLPGLAGACPLSIVPSCMEDLNEGAEHEEQVRGWLKKWKRRVRKDAEKEIQKEKKTKKSSRRRGEDSDSEYEEEEARNDLENPLVLIGPPGVGKTALIRTLAKQENMKIISTGPEVERTGAEIKKKLQEAMRSHRVDQTAHRRMTFFVSSKDKNATNPYQARAKSPSILDKEYTQSLIVFEHVDVFFETLDRHGLTALLEVVNEAAVPVVFTAETRDWPRSSGQMELSRMPLEVEMRRSGQNTWKYVQKLIYSCRDVFIDDSTISALSSSVNHDLQALIHQAHFYSLSPALPLPLTSRKAVPSGFSIDWELETTRKAPKCHRNSDRAQEVLELYSEFFEGDTSRIDGRTSWRRTENPESESEALETAVEAMRGRYTRRQLAEDVLPLLVPINRAEQAKKLVRRRHVHRFDNPAEDFPIDGSALKWAVDIWATMENR